MNEQQQFWKEKYAASYRDKNDNFNEEKGIEAWKLMLSKAEVVNSYLECGSNIGRNISFLQTVLPNAQKAIIEISLDAYQITVSRYNPQHSFNGAILESDFNDESFNLVYTMGVLIHIHPEDLLDNMRKMFNYSNKYILFGEYFNRTPVMIEYQGEQNKLFKRDFGRLFMENFNVQLVDYGFLWGHIYDDAGFDDITWWLFEKC
jgi:pseudaminic acid biosynthesis-associated methylase